MTTASASPADRLPVWLSTLLPLAAAFVLLCYVAVTLAHIADTYHVGHVSGVWIGLARYLNDGVLYPAVYEDGRFAGSRYMPLFFTLHAGLAAVTGEYVMSGKLLSLAVTLACGALVFWTVRRLGCGWTVAVVLATLALVSSSGFLASTTIRGDLLPVVWQLAALLAVHRSRKPTAALVAGLCCTLAVLSKVTAGWAPLAIIAVTIRSDRKFLLLFLAAWLGSLAAAVLALHVLSAGRLLASFRVFSEPGFLGLLLKSPVRLLKFLTTTCPLLLVAMPFVLLECSRAVAQRRLTVYHWAIFCDLPVLLVIFADRGTDYNHLVDLAVLSVVLVGMLWAGQTEGTSLKPVLAVALLWALGATWAANLGFPVRDVITGSAQPARPNKPLADVIPDDAVMLTEDPLVDASRGRLPVVLDPYALPFIERKHPEWVADLERRVKQREFAFVVLQYRVDLDPEVEDGWYRNVFGVNVRDAILANYRFQLQREGFCVYVPK
jgi:hypothetical protein